MFYSKQTGGFYTHEIHGDNIPADAVEITIEEHQALLEGQSQGKIISADKNGRPVLKDPPPPTPAQVQRNTNATSLAYLSSTDWYVTRFAEVAVPIPPDVLEARAAARASIIKE